MANLEDLGYKSILDMDNDEAIDVLRQIRLSRRIPEKATASQSSTKTIRKKVTSALSADMAAELLALLENTK